MPVSGSSQLVVFCVIAAIVILSATLLTFVGAIDAQAYVALVSLIAGGVVGMLNPVTTRPPSA